MSGNMHSSNSANEIEHEQCKEGHSAKLESNSGNHHVRAWLRITTNLVRFRRSHPTTDRLNHKRNDITSTEDNGIHLCREDAGLATELKYEDAEQHVESCGKEYWSDNECDDLNQKSIMAVWALGRPSPSGPSQSFDWRDGISITVTKAKKS